MDLLILQELAHHLEPEPSMTPPPWMRAPARPEKSSHILLVGSNIGDHHGPLHYTQAVDAVFPHLYPAEDRAIELAKAAMEKLLGQS